MPTIFKLPASRVQFPNHKVGKAFSNLLDCFQNYVQLQKAFAITLLDFYWVGDLISL